ncbi:MAG: twin-arginine translocase TatA/TatE family subunit [Solirubrobacterales bacterium]|nr:twin-arginine translocase TatA/TatE family subunit [Solirubrobacterales bacterium]
MLGGILQPTHLLLIGLVLLLVLGPKRLPDAGRALGQGIKEFKSSIGTHESEQAAPEHPALEAEQHT